MERRSLSRLNGVSSALEIDVAPKFRPLLDPSRYKAAHGGRGSGKSQFFADLMVATAIRKPGFRGLCCREVQKSLKESAKRLIEQKITAHGLGHMFDVQEAQIKTPGGGIIVFAGLQDHTSESIKSYEGFDVAWVEEAQTVSNRSLNLLRPTIRTPGSELWFSWNPRRKIDAVDEMLRGEQTPTGAVVVEANWRDNPWFPDELEQERLDCQRMQADQYEHIWEGGYVTVAEGAYYAAPLTQAKADGRIGRVAFDPLMTVRLFVDIGGTGAKADAFTMWPAQFIGREIRVRDYYEVVGQPLAAHLNWLRSKGYTPDRAQFWLPHDGATHDKVFSVSYQSALEEAGYTVTVVPNQGKGAAAARVEAARRIFPSIWFDEDSTQAGRDALGWYHEKKDEARNIGLGPEHDWASHGADSFGLMAVTYEVPQQMKPLDLTNLKRGIV
jgi:phage terminase large subunit